MTNEDKYFLNLRGISEDDVCPGCNGTGIKVYGNGSTWRGGIGACAMTNDVCNKCWGSGSKTYKWPSHKEFYQLKKAAEKCQHPFDCVNWTLKSLNSWERVYKCTKCGEEL